MQRELVIGGFYRHFKNKLYQVRGVAIHSVVLRHLRILYPQKLAGFTDFGRIDA